MYFHSDFYGLKLYSDHGLKNVTLYYEKREVVHETAKHSAIDDVMLLSILLC